MKTIEEATTISARDRELLTRAKEAILKWIPNATVLVYGSMARGDQTDESDIDLLVLTPGTPSNAERIGIRSALTDIEFAYGVVLSLSVRAKQEWDSGRLAGSPFRFNVERDGIVT